MQGLIHLCRHDVLTVNFLLSASCLVIHTFTSPILSTICSKHFGAVCMDSVCRLGLTFHHKGEGGFLFHFQVFHNIKGFRLATHVQTSIYTIGFTGIYTSTSSGWLAHTEWPSYCPLSAAITTSVKPNS